MKATDINYTKTSNGNPKNKIVLIGMLEDGPPGKGFTIDSNKSAMYLLGKNQMTKNHNLLTQAGIPHEDIIFYRLNGRQSQKVFDVLDVPFFTFSSIGANNRDNDISVTVSEKGISVQSNYSYGAIEDGDTINEVQKKLHPNFKRAYSFEEYPYLSDLSSIVNQDASLGLIDVVSKEHAHGKCLDYFTTVGEYRLSMGASETTMCVEHETLAEGYEELYWPYFNKYVIGEQYDGENYSELASIPAEIFYFSDIHLDRFKELAFFAGKLAEDRTSAQDILCTSLFQTSPVPEKFTLGEGDYMVDSTHYFSVVEGETLEYLPYKERTDFSNKLVALYTDDEREPSYWQNVQTVVGEEVDSEGGLTPGAIHHAVNYLREPFYSSLSNKELTEMSQIKEELSKSLIASISSKGYICIVPSIRKNNVCSYVQNMAYKRGGLLENFNNQRLVSYLSKDISNMLDKYIGNTMSYFSYSDTGSLIEQYLEQFLENNSIASFEVEIPEDYQSNESVFVSISLSLYNEVKKVESQISVSKDGWEVDLWNLSSNN